MIILTINPNTQPTTHSFSKKSVTIGSVRASQGEIDLPLSDTSLSSELLTIEYLHDRYIAFNTTNDPFLTVNGHPFGKKHLKKGDLLGIGKTEILFDFNEGTIPLPTTVTHSSHEPQKLHTAPAETLPSPVFESPKISPLQKLEAEMKINQLLAKEEEEPPLAQEITFTNQEASPPQALPIAQPESIFWKRIGIVASATFAVIVLAVATIYFVVKEQNHTEEIQAAQSLADIAMALTHAQLHHIKPSNQNWLDPEFLKNNIEALLPLNSTPFSSLDIQGQLKDSPYFVRIYTNDSNSQFLVIAQPNPNWLQWMIPKTALLIDSGNMEIRKTTDIRTLNRFLADPEIFSSENSAEISNLVHHGQIVPLSHLALLGKHSEFIPPKELALVRPGAENLIYNAPRYYRFSEPISRKVEALNENPDNTQQIAPLLQNLTIVAKLHDMVIYTSGGVQNAVETQKGLAPYAPTQGFLIGYLSVDSQGKLTKGSHLVLTANSFNKQSLETEEKLNRSAPPASTPENSSSAGVDIHHPLFELLSKLALERQQGLQKISEEMINLLNAHKEKGGANFSEKFQQLTNQYEQISLALQFKTEKELLRLYHLYVGGDPQGVKVTSTAFLAYVDAAGLESFVHNTMKLQSLLQQNGMSHEKAFGQLSKAIKEAQDFQELNIAVEKASNLLSKDEIPEEISLAAFQNQLRMIVLQKLEKILLFPSETALEETFHEKNRSVLLNILKNGHVTDPAEREFYINEFDALE